MTDAPETRQLSAQQSKQLRRAALVFAVIALVASVVVFLVIAMRPSAAATADAGSNAAVRKALAERLPKTRIGDVRCDKLGGLCEVSAGNTLFYTDPRARYLVIGRVYDMETRTDLTAARLLELNPDTLLGAAARREDSGGAGASPSPVVARNVPLSELPKDGAINWGPATGPKVVVFSDFRCGYCMRLSHELTALGARVEERPISVLGSRAIADQVYCAKNPVAALHAAYAQAATLPAAPKCDTSGLDANEAFAKRHGFAGTPVVVRPDGQVIEGYRPAAEIAAWLKAVKAAA